MYNEQDEILTRVSEEEKERLQFEAENFSLQPKKSWKEWEQFTEEASTFEDLLSPEEIKRWYEKGLLNEEQAQEQLKKWSELGH